VIVDGDMEELPTGGARFVVRIAGDTMAWLMYAANFLMSMYNRLHGAASS
jgi:hypothetical protein